MKSHRAVVNVALAAILVAAFAHLKVPQSVKVFVHNSIWDKPEEHRDLPEGHVSAAGFAVWMGAYTALALVLIGGSDAGGPTAEVMSGLAVLIAVSSMIAASPDLRELFGQAPSAATQGSQGVAGAAAHAGAAVHPGGA